MNRVTVGTIAFSCGYGESMGAAAGLRSGEPLARSFFGILSAVGYVDSH